MSDVLLQVGLVGGDAMSVWHQADGSVVLPGQLPVHDLPDIGLELPEGDYATVAGFILSRLGRLPTGPGDALQCDAWELRVTDVDDCAITEVHIAPRAAAPTPSDGDDGPDCLP